jgi:hypothetical protein
MKKELLLIYLLTTQLVLAQATTQLSVLQYQGKPVTALTIELPHKIDYVKQLFDEKLEMDRLGTPLKGDQNFLLFRQIKLARITTSYLDVYYQIEELNTISTRLVKITMLISKGYDNFITKESDAVTTQNVMDLLNEIGISVERKNFELQLMTKEQEVATEKQKLFLLEEEVKIIENERKEIDKRVIAKELLMRNQAKITHEKSNDLGRLKVSINDFENKNPNKTKSILETNN